MKNVQYSCTREHTLSILTIGSLNLFRFTHTALHTFTTRIAKKERLPRFIPIAMIQCRTIKKNNSFRKKIQSNTTKRNAIHSMKRVQIAVNQAEKRTANEKIKIEFERKSKNGHNTS